MLVPLNEEFNRAKEALLKYYSDVQVSLGARLIGFSVALFALFEAFGNFSFSGLSGKLSEIIFGETVTPPFLALMQGILFFLGTLILVIYMVRTILRYASVSGFCNALQGVAPFPVDAETVVHAKIVQTAYRNMLNDNNGKGSRVFFVFSFSLFIGGDIGKDEKKRMEKDNYLGWFWCILIATMLTVVLFVLFW